MADSFFFSLFFFPPLGIDPKHISMIFEPFSLPFRLREGSGLGLSVSQRLVHGLGGHISVTSQLGEGSRFWFDLVLPVMYVKFLLVIFVHLKN